MTEREFAGRLVLGTAQFGLAYGINNTAGQPSLDTVGAILREARAADLTLLDTAAAYGDAEARLGALLPPDDEIQLITKISITSPAQIRSQLQEALTRLRRASVHGVLLHNAGVAGKVTPEVWHELQALRTDGLVNQIGISAYSPLYVEEMVAQQMVPDVVQLPLNALDYRHAGRLPRLAEHGIAFHARSAFLQGLLLREPATLPIFFRPLKPKIRRLRELAADGGIAVAALLLLFAVQTPGISRVVIGVDSVENLHQNLRAAAHWNTALQLRSQLEALVEETDTFILPYTWPKTT